MKTNKIILSIFAILGFALVFAFATVTEATQSESDLAAEVEALRLEIDELRALINLLLVAVTAQQGINLETQVAPPAIVTETVVPAPTISPPTTSSSRTQRPQNPAITREAAIEIARADMVRRGHTGTFRSAEMDFERNMWVWEIEFRDGRIEMEWYISVDTGAIIKFERER